jgi:cyclopropane fatty-acyl-phospholipid synthase-like methyltransferase
LIKIAQSETSNLKLTQKPKFIAQDMLSFLEQQEQQNFNIVVAVASFQHVPTKWERLLILKNIYRVLDYDAIVLMFNWSFSKWFFKKYTGQIIKSLLI